MRKPEEYYVEMVKHSAFNDFGKFQKDVLNAIKQAQIEAIDETVKRCAEKGKCKSEVVSINDAHAGIPKSKTTKIRFVIDKNSMVQVVDELKKELE